MSVKDATCIDLFINKQFEIMKMVKEANENKLLEVWRQTLQEDMQNDVLLSHN